MFRQPDVSATHIAFVYAGDIWVVPQGRAASPCGSARRGARSSSRGFRPTGRRSPSAPTTTATSTSTSCRRRAATRCASRTTRWPIALVGLASRRHAGAVRLEPRQRASALQPVLPGAGHRRPARQAAGAVRRVRQLLARRQAHRLPAADAGVPHLEALSRRMGARHLGVRPDDAGGVECHEERPRWTSSRCGTATRCTSSRTAARASSRTSGRASRATGAVRQITDFQRLRRHVPVAGTRPTSCLSLAAGCTCRIWRPTKVSEVPVQVVTDRSTLKAQEREGRRRASPRSACRPTASAPSSRRAARFSACRPSTAR